MKIRIADRLLVALTGLVMIALCVAGIAQVFVGVPVTGTVKGWIAEPTPMVIIIEVLVLLAVLLLGVYCVGMLFRHKKGKRGFVAQATEIGDMHISLKAIEKLVSKCAEPYSELKLTGVSLEEEKQSLIVKLKVCLNSGISVPLAVGALQRQIKQYVTDCTGVDVKEVRVQVDMDGEPSEDSPYLVKQLSQRPVAARLHDGEHQIPVAAELKEEDVPVLTAEKPEAAPAEEMPQVQEVPVQEPVQEAAAEAEETPAEDAEAAAEEEVPAEAAHETAETEEDPAEEEAEPLYKTIFGDFIAAAEKAAEEKEQEDAPAEEAVED